MTLKNWQVDWYLGLPVLVLTALSLTTLLSISFTFFITQLIYFLVGVGFFIFFSRVDFENLRYFTLPIYVGSLIFLTIVLGIGLETRGAVRWIDLLGFHIQFSEICKPFLIVALAGFLSKRDASWRTLIQVILVVMPIAFLIYKQPDLGSLLIYLFVTAGILLVTGFSWWWFGLGIFLTGIVIPLSWRFLHDYQKERILTFLHMRNDPLGTSYNAIQAIIAVGSGSLLGKGWGQGTQSALRFLPERHTDFLFATLSEDLGFAGGVIVIVVFGLLLFRIYILATNADTSFERIFLCGVFLLLLIQFFFNVGMNIGLLPIVGVTLPFMSYGGSSLLSNAILLGLASSIGNKQADKYVLEIK